MTADNYVKDFSGLVDALIVSLSMIDEIKFDTHTRYQMVGAIMALGPRLNKIAEKLKEWGVT